MRMLVLVKRRERDAIAGGGWFNTPGEADEFLEEHGFENEDRYEILHYPDQELDAAWHEGSEEPTDA